MKNRKKKLLHEFLLGITVLLFALFITAPVSASENVHNFTHGETNSEISHLAIKVKNSESSSITISFEDRIVYENQVELGTIESLMETKNNGKHFITIIKRLQGTGNMMNYAVLEIEDYNLTEIYTSPFYERASYEIVENNLQVTYPAYETDDTAIESQLMKVDQYTYGKGIEKTITENNSSQDKPAYSAHSTTTKANITGTNPSPAQINQILTEEAIKKNIPPEVVKAIAYQESNMQQYWNPQSVPVSHYQNYCTPERAASNPNYLAWDGTNVKLGYDCIGIGIMQVSDWRFIENKADRERYVERLKNDLRFNIQEGLDILEEKWRFANARHTDGKPLIPTVNDKDRRVIDNWYFAILAYNGMLSINDPTASNTRPYQETVYQHISTYGLVDVTPFPVNKLNTYLNPGSSLLRFEQNQYTTLNPLTFSKAQITSGNAVHTTENVNIRSLADVNAIVSPGLPKGTRLTVLDLPVQYPNNINSHYTFIPVRTDSGREGYVASSYLNPTSHSLSGANRYETGVSISNFGWENQFPAEVVLGRGDLPIDSLTGSVLAANKNAPLLLTTPSTLPTSIAEEIKRLKPKRVYVLGGEGAISKDVVNQISGMNIEIVRVVGANRYETAVSVANVYSPSSVNEIFLTTGDENSPDSLSIASYAGSNSTPILLTTPTTLRNEVSRFIAAKNVKKVTIIGGTGAVSANVEVQLKALGVTVERVSGADRYETSVAIAKKYFDNAHLSSVFFARGDVLVDALSGSALAAKYKAPVILTRSTDIPAAVSTWLGGIDGTPVLIYLGSTNVISPSVRDMIEKIVLN